MKYYFTLIVCIFVFTLRAQLPPICFNTVITNTQLPGFCVDLVSEDFDNDGLPDIAASVLSADQVFVMKGDGSGNFYAAPTSTFATGGYPHRLVSADFNNDGNMDLVTVNSLSNSISLLLGTGTASFLPQVVFATGNYPRSLTQGDFNNDGNTDIAVSNYLSGNVSVFLGTGTGSFSPLVNYAVLQGAEAITTGDYNNDGNQDLAVCCWTSEYIQILYGNGNGTFLPTVGCPVYTFNNYGDAITTADLNNDGYDDLVVNDDLTGALSALLGTSNFSMSPYYNLGNSTLIGNVHKMALSDINGDGTADIISPTATNFLRGYGTGTFAAIQTFSNFSGAAVVVKDFNLDGKPDLGFVQNQLQIVLNQPVMNISTTSSTLICPGHQITLNAMGANSYTWNNGQQTSAINVAPLSTSSYTVNGTGIPGCTNSAHITFSVISQTDSTMLASMSISSSKAATVCAGTPINVCVTGGVTYTWSNGSTASCIYDIPTSTTTYSVSVVNNGGCPKNMNLTQYVDVCTGTKEVSGEEKSVRIYPNPGSNFVHIVTPDALELNILSSAGTTLSILVMDAGDHTVDLSGYAAGVYTFIVNGKKQRSKAVKFILLP